MKNLLHRELSAGYMTNWAARLFARAIDRRLQEIGLSSGQLPVFFALGEGGSLSQRALLDIVEIEQPTMAATLGRMERDGLIERRPDPDDRRSSLISLTATAREKLPLVRDAVRSVNEAALSDLSEAERDLYLGMLGTVIKALRQA
jgi:MarR family transcriptional regulator, transcriptional regulator for hemolysin